MRASDDVELPEASPRSWLVPIVAAGLIVAFLVAAALVARSRREELGGDLGDDEQSTLDHQLAPVGRSELDDTDDWDDDWDDEWDDDSELTPDRER